MIGAIEIYFVTSKLPRCVLLKHSYCCHIYYLLEEVDVSNGYIKHSLLHVWDHVVAVLQISDLVTWYIKNTMPPIMQGKGIAWYSAWSWTAQSPTHFKPKDVKVIKVQNVTKPVNDIQQQVFTDLSLSWYDFNLSALWHFKLTLSVPNFRRHLSSAIFILANYRSERRLYVKLKNWMSNSVDPDETAHWAVSSGSMLFAKAYYYCLWQWKS